MKEGSASVRVRRRPWREEAGDTLDTATVSDVRHNLRAALRSKYKLDESITIKHFGYIDQPQPDQVEFMNYCTWLYVEIVEEKYVTYGYMKFRFNASKYAKCFICLIKYCEAQARVRQGKARKGKKRQGWRKVKGLKA